MSEIKPTQRNTPWAKEELEAAVEAYFQMMTEEKKGNAYNKSAFNRTLRAGALSERSRGSIEYRMQNISYVLELLHQPFLKGYLPARNIGKASADKIASIILKNGYINFNDIEVTTDHSNRAKQISRKVKLSPPKGNKSPRRKLYITSNFERDPEVVSWVLKLADGKCEACLSSAPFTDGKGKPFLEVHHITMLCDGGEDTIENAIAACPNCHRRLHYSNDKDEFKTQIKNRISRLI